MFENARIKLTGWYTLIIFVISTLFSVGVYRVATVELTQGMRIQAFRMLPRNQQDELLNRHPELEDVIIRRHLPLFRRAPTAEITFDDILFQDTKRRLGFQLILVDTIIVIAGSLVSYFLAGRTLAPLGKTIEDQKRFVSDASHELRTPLTNMRTEIEVAMRDRKMKLNDAKKLLESNLEEVNKMQSLSSYLLSLNKYENGSKNLPFKTVNLKEVIEQAIKKFSAQAKNQHITIEHKLETVSISGDKVSLVELFSILIDNAIKYSKDNGRIIIRNFTKGNHKIVEVRDFGIGIDAKDIPHIFDRFYRADTSRCKDMADGYGLGLAIAKSIVGRHNGEISVTSKIHTGSIFTITF